MNECYSFRQLASQVSPDHRLMYLHSATRPIHFPYNSCQRIRTMQNECEGENSTCGSLTNKIQRHLSCKDNHFNTVPIHKVLQKKIKYFKLDLTKLVNSSSFNQSNYSHFNEADDDQQEKKGVLGSFPNKFNNKKEQNTKDKSIYKNKLSEFFNQNNSTSKVMEKIFNSNFAKLQNNYSGGKIIQNIKNNTINKNSKQNSGKQNSLRNNYALKHPKIIKPSHFFQKSATRSQIREQLELKRLQKIVVDKSGHQFRIIIQKIK